MDLLAVDERPVARFEILDDHTLRARRQPRVAPRHQLIAGQLQVGPCLAPDLDGLLGEHDAPADLRPLDDLEHVLAHRRPSI